MMSDVRRGELLCRWMGGARREKVESGRRDSGATKSMVRWCWMALTMMFLCAVAGNAQSFRGIILGTVTDSTGASVSGANVTVKNLETGLTRAVTTRGAGTYSGPD